MATYAKEGSRRCFDLSQDINWHGSHDELWDEFKEKNPQYKDFPNRKMKQIMDDFFSYCAKVLVETPHGIVLNRIGYFSMTAFENKKMVKHNGKIIPNFKNNGEVYRCYFYPIRGWNTSFRWWLFTVNKTLKGKIKEQIQDKGMKYYNHIKFLNRNPHATKGF